MAIQEVFRGVGSWSIQLADDTPAELRDLLDEHRYGRVVVDAARDNPAVLGDALLASARYVGVLYGTSPDSATGFGISGQGMAVWMGDADKKASTVFETPASFTGSTFASAIAGLIPPALTLGTVVAPSGGGSYTGKHQWTSPREAIDYVCDLFDCAWRVNGDATLDAGPASALFVDTPTAAIVARAEGGDQQLRGLRGSAKLDRDMNDFSTRVVTLAEGQGSTVRVGSADIAPGLNTYKDPQGNPVQWVRMVSESNTSLTNANARAQLQLNRFTSPRNALNLTTDTHDIRGDVAAGDQVWCYDPDAGLVDNSNEVRFRGDLIYPVKLQVTQLTWGVLRGMGVYFRDTDGAWWDLTDYVVWETDSATQIVVGGYNRSLTDSGTEPIGSRVVADNSIPGVPGLVLPWNTGVYQSAAGLSRAKIVAAWSQPLNADGSAIVDGDHYDVQYRTPAGSGDWSTMVVGFDQTQASILELQPATEYGIRIRAVDTASPPNYGEWTGEQAVTSGGDTIAPATPAAPAVAGNPVSIQVQHTLGVAAGGTYNLDADLHHLEVHASDIGAGFTTSAATKIGELAATQGMMSSTVPAIGTFTVANTGSLWVKVVAVDDSGNRSPASAASSASATLIDSAHISDVVASLITTGNMNAVLALVGAVQTASSGARWRADSTGWKTYRPSGTLALWNDSSTGDLIGYQTNGTTPTLRIQASTGNFYLYASNGTTPMLQLTASTGELDINGRLIAGAGIGVGRSIVIDPTTGTPQIRLYPDNRSTVYGVIEGIPGNDIVGAGWVRISSATVSSKRSDVLVQPTGVTIGYAPAGLLSGGAVSATQDGVELIKINASSGDAEGGLLNINSSGMQIAAPSGEIETVDPLGGNGAGLKFRAQGGATQGYRMYASGGYLRFAQNSDNAFLADPNGPGGLKCFVIDHPIHEDRLLVHACTEAPAATVEYRGRATIVDHQAVVELPTYFEAATIPTDRHVQVTIEAAPERVERPAETAGPPLEGPQIPAHTLPMPEAVAPAIPEHHLLYRAAASAPEDGRFRIVSDAPDGTVVYWHVQATRADSPQFEVEPLRSSVNVHGDGPYRYITPAA